MSGILISGIVSHRDKRPYVQIDIGGHLVQCTMAQARNVARDIEIQCARAEADAMIFKFFDAQEYPPGAAAALMVAFRDFRGELDDESVKRERFNPDPPAGEGG